MQKLHGLILMTLFSLPGCGTLCNLKDPPTGPNHFGMEVCSPLGGMMRSGTLATAGTALGAFTVVDGSTDVMHGDFGGGCKRIGEGAGLVTMGLLAIADVPLSIGADIVTLPIAYARSKEQPWATWWGQQSDPHRSRPPQPPDQPASDPERDAQIRVRR